MEFTFETVYDKEGIRVMAEAIRRTVRRKRNRRSHIMGWLVVVLALLLLLPIGDRVFVLNVRTVVTILAMAAIVIVLLFEDRINAYVARKRMLTGMNSSVCSFRQENYTSATALGKTEFYYENIQMLAEGKDYFVFVFDLSHGQIYDKRTLSGGTVEEFRRFIQEKTGKEIKIIQGEKTI